MSNNKFFALLIIIVISVCLFAVDSEMTSDVTLQRFTGLFTIDQASIAIAPKFTEMQNQIDKLQQEVDYLKEKTHISDLRQQVFELQTKMDLIEKHLPNLQAIVKEEQIKRDEENRLAKEQFRIDDLRQRKIQSKRTAAELERIKINTEREQLNLISQKKQIRKD